MQRRTTLGGLLALGVGLQAAAQPASPRTASTPVCPAASWLQHAPDASGWNAARLRHADEQARLLGSDAVLVVHRGAIVHSYGDVAQPRELYSVRKSILGMLF